MKVVYKVLYRVLSVNKGSVIWRKYSESYYMFMLYQFGVFVVSCSKASSYS